MESLMMHLGNQEICGDDHLTKLQVLRYIYLNFFRGLLGYRTRLKTKKYPVAITVTTGQSPMRAYNNRFFETYLRRFISERKNVDLLEIGCGTGTLHRTLNKINFSGNYTGIDKRESKHWKTRRSEKSRFICTSIENFETDKTFDLIVSYNAMEHIERDDLMMEKCKKMIKSDGIQIHTVPSFWSLLLYLDHGYRQYYPENIKRIFGEKCEVYRLGGFFTMLVHFVFITIPALCRITLQPRNTVLYRKCVGFSSMLDSLIGHRFNFSYGIIKRIQD